METLSLKNMLDEIFAGLLSFTEDECFIGDIVGGKVLELQTDKALQKGKELGEKIGEIKGICETAQEFGGSKESLKKKLIEKFNLTEAEAQSHIDKYWKE